MGGAARPGRAAAAGGGGRVRGRPRFDLSLGQQLLTVGAVSGRDLSGVPVVGVEQLLGQRRSHLSETTAIARHTMNSTGYHKLTA